MTWKTPLIILVFFYGIFSRPLYAQTSKFQLAIDSLERAYEREKSDTQQINILHKCVSVCLYQSEFKKGYGYIKRSGEQLKKMDWPKGEADNDHFKAVLDFYSGNYDLSLKENLEALKIRTEIKDYKGMAASYGNIGLIYQVRADYPTALKYQYLGLDMEEKRKNEDGIAASYTNIGLIFEHLGDYNKAKSFYLKSLRIRERLKDTFDMARAYSNLGNAYYSMNNQKKALRYYEKSLELALAAEDITGCAIAYANIGNMHYEKGDYHRSLEYQLKCLEIVERVGDDRIWISAASNAADNYLKLGNLEKSKYYATEALAKARALNLPDQELAALSSINHYYEETSQWEKANESFKQYIALRDTLSSQDRSKEAARREIQYEFDKRAEKQKQKAREDSRKQQIIIYSVSLGLLVALIFAILILRNLRINKRKNKIIQYQKTLVEEKQKEILDSINYAKKIQYALLAHDDLLKQNLPEHFVFFKPKDIVSGDFYWGTVGVPGSKFQVPTGEAISNSFYLAVCDSTGHGVPGAFMSLLNISFLNEAINEKGIEAPNEVFNHVRKRLIENVSHEGAQDGMDATLIKFEIRDLKFEINNSSFQIQYAAAYNAPLVIRNGEIVEGKCDKMPIGKGESSTPFNLYTLNLQKGDMLYLYTDGYADQFGGGSGRSGGKKLKESGLRNQLIQVAGKPCQQQRGHLENFLNEWTGNHEQIDDICIIGIRI